MHWVTAIALYAVIWWLVLFTVLPFGIRGQHETGPFAEGTDPGAPVRGRLGRKALQTTLLALLVWGSVYGLIASGLVTLDSFGFLPNPGRPLE